MAMKTWPGRPLSARGDVGRRGVRLRDAPCFGYLQELRWYAIPAVRERHVRQPILLTPFEGVGQYEIQARSMVKFRREPIAGLSLLWCLHAALYATKFPAQFSVPLWEHT